MAANNMFFRALYYPIALVRGIHRIGKEGSRDLNNRRRFPNAIIDDNVCINSSTSIAANTHILEGSIINYSDISQYSYIGRNTVVQYARIGKFCSVGTEVCIGLGKHPIDHFSTSTLFYRKRNTLGIALVDEDLDFAEYEEIEVGHDVWIGARALIVDGVKIGTGAIIAANSVVTKDVPPYSIVGGVPAKVIRYRFDEERIADLLQSKWWEEDLDTIKMKRILNKANDTNNL